MSDTPTTSTPAVSPTPATCSTCAHWVRHKPRTRAEGDSVVTTTSQYGECYPKDLFQVTGVSVEHPAGDQVYDYDGHEVNLDTLDFSSFYSHGEKFGCIFHSPRPPESNSPP